MKKIIFISILIAAFATGKMQAQNSWEKIELPDSVKITKLYLLDDNTLF